MICASVLVFYIAAGNHEVTKQATERGDEVESIGKLVKSERSNLASWHCSTLKVKWSTTPDTSLTPTVVSGSGMPAVKYGNAGIA